MTTIKEYTDAIEVVNEVIKYGKSTDSSDEIIEDLKTMIEQLKVNRYKRVKQLAEQPENEK